MRRLTNKIDVEAVVRRAVREGIESGYKSFDYEARSAGVETLPELEQKDVLYRSIMWALENILISE